MAQRIELTTAQKRLLTKLGAHRRKVDATKAKLDSQFEELNDRYRECAAEGIPATEMARACGAPPDKVSSAAESIRQVLQGKNRYTPRRSSE